MPTQSETGACMPTSPTPSSASPDHCILKNPPLYQLLTQTDHKADRCDILNQLNLFD